MEIPAKFKAAAVQAAPVFMDREATTDKAVRLIHEAASNGAKLVAFPEVFIPGYPYWNWIMNPFQGSAWFKKLVKAAVDVPGPTVTRLCKEAQDAGVYVVIGINERSPVSLGTLFNTILFISPEGRLIGRHRKLVATFAEKLTWAGGDGSSLRVYDTPLGKLGALACGENTNTLSRYTLLAQGELIHVANYIGFPFTSDYSMPEGIRIRAGAHSFEGKVFTIVACSAVSDEIIDAMSFDEDSRKLMSGSPNAFTGIFGPSGQLIGEPLIDVEGIVYGDIDLDACIEPKQYHDILGGYNRFDIFDLRVNRRKTDPITFLDPQPDLSDGFESLPNRGYTTDKTTGRSEETD